MKALAGEYDMILPDARGHGLSDQPPTGYAPQDHAADVAGLIRGLGLERPILIGHSMGAGVAATVAAHYPDLVAGAILEDPPWRAGARRGHAPGAGRAGGRVAARTSSTGKP